MGGKGGVLIYMGGGKLLGTGTPTVSRAPYR